MVPVPGPHAVLLQPDQLHLGRYARGQAHALVAVPAILIELRALVRLDDRLDIGGAADDAALAIGIVLVVLDRARVGIATEKAPAIFGGHWARIPSGRGGR